MPARRPPQTLKGPTTPVGPFVVARTKAVTMGTRRRRPCLICGTLTRNPSRCDPCQATWQQQRDQQRGSSTQRGYGSTWRTASTTAIAAHRAATGDWCPGWQMPPHPATDLTADHITAKANGGTDHPDNIQVLCIACNSRKGARNNNAR